MKFTLKLEGARELDRKLKKIGTPPQKYVTKAAKAGMRIALKATKKGGFLDQTGALRKGTKLIGEKSRLKGKKVYQVVFDRAKNDIFQKPIKNKIRSKSNTAYYPASMEYGYWSRAGNYIPGFHFMKHAITDNASTIERTTVKSMSNSIEEIMRK